MVLIKSISSLINVSGLSVYPGSCYDAEKGNLLVKRKEKSKDQHHAKKAKEEEKNRVKANKAEREQEEKRAEQAEKDKLQSAHENAQQLSKTMHTVFESCIPDSNLEWRAERGPSGIFYSLDSKAAAFLGDVIEYSTPRPASLCGQPALRPSGGHPKAAAVEGPARVFQFGAPLRRGHHARARHAA